VKMSKGGTEVTEGCGKREAAHEGETETREHV